MLDKNLLSLPGMKRSFALVCVLTLVKGACIVGYSLALSSSISHLWAGEQLDTVVFAIALFTLLYICSHGVGYVIGRYLDAVSHRHANQLRMSLVSHLFDTGHELIATHGTAGITTAALEGVDQVESYIKSMLARMAGVMLLPLIVLVSVFYFDWVSGIILLVLFPVTILYMVLLGNAAKNRAERQLKSYRLMANHFLDTLRGIETLKASGASKGYAASIYEVSERFRKATMSTMRVAILSGAVLDLIATAGVAAVSIMLAFRLLDGSMLLFTGLSILVLSPEYFRPIREFASDFHASLDGKNALALLLSMVDGERESTVDGELGDEVRNADERGIDVPRADATINPWSAESTIEVRDLSFSYNARDDASSLSANESISDITFAVRGFEKVGIIGASGAGKSTLVSLLGGFATPTSGSFVVDGSPAADLSLPSWQQQAIYIPQHPHIFHASLRDNIAFYKPDVLDEEVRAAIEAMGLGDLLDVLPDGLDTIIGESARGLSGGQAQRIALARAFLDPSRRILLFDEPTAHLDIETEYELKERMLPLMEDRLVFFATHRLHWIPNMDRVLVFDGGKLAYDEDAHAIPRDEVLRLVSAGGDGR